jgi:hypothetical protein
VRFFRKSPAPGPAPRRVHHPWNPPEAELPGIAPIDTLHFDRSEQAAIAVTGISAYARGFEFFVARRIRPGTPGLDEDPTPEMRRRMLTEQDPFQISLQFSDGRTAISSRAHGDSEPTGPILRRRGGGGTSHSQLLRWWAWPLPPTGPLEFICQWPVYRIGETRVGLDAQLILDAARRSIQLWPEDDPNAAAWAARDICGMILGDSVGASPNAGSRDELTSGPPNTCSWDPGTRSAGPWPTKCSRGHQSPYVGLHPRHSARSHRSFTAANAESTCCPSGAGAART